MPDTEKQDPQLVAALALLERLIRTAGWKFQDVDAKLGFQRGWVSRVLHGNIRLAYQHLLQILDVIGVDPYLFFSTLHPPRRQASAAPVSGNSLEVARALAELVLRDLPSSPTTDPPTSAFDDDFEARVSAAVRAVLAERRGPLRPDRK